jgi:hypothetical protein
VTTPNVDGRLRRRTHLFGILVAWAASLSVLSVVVQVMSVAAPLWRGGPITATLLNTLKELILTAPALFYVAGLIRSRRVFRRIGQGDLFTRANSEGLIGVGAALLAGSVWAMLVAGLEPSIHADVLGPIAHDIAQAATQLALAALGLALFMIGRVMREAVRLKADADGFV